MPLPASKRKRLNVSANARNGPHKLRRALRLQLVARAATHVAMRRVISVVINDRRPAMNSAMSRHGSRNDKHKHSARTTTRPCAPHRAAMAVEPMAVPMNALNAPCRKTTRPSAKRMAASACPS